MYHCGVVAPSTSLQLGLQQTPANTLAKAYSVPPNMQACCLAWSCYSDKGTATHAVAQLKVQQQDGALPENQGVSQPLW